MHKKFLIAVILIFATATAHGAELTGSAANAPTSTSWLDQDTATGNWNGFRSKLASEGVTISSNYTTDIAGNPSGGLNQAVEYSGFLSLAAALDMEKIASLKGWALTISNYLASGRNLSTVIGNYYDVQEIYTSGNYFFGELDLSLSLPDDKVTLEAGRLFAGDVFATSPLWQYYVSSGLNSYFGSIPSNIFFPAFNIAAWAARATYQPNQEWCFNAGVYNADTRVQKPENHGAYFGLDMDNGCLAIGQMTYKYNHDSNGTSLPGSAMFGSYYQSSKFQDLSDPTRERHGNYGLYLILEQMIYRGDWPEFNGPRHMRSDAKYAEQAKHPHHFQVAAGADRPKGLTAWAGAYIAPQEHTNQQEYQLTGGFVYQGLPPGRNRDVTAFCVIMGKFSDQLPGQDMETVLELNHRFQISQWLYITPDMQYVIKPNGQSNIDDALVLGVEASINF